MQFLFINGFFSTDIAKAMSWMLIHSLWQGLVAAILAGIVIINTNRSGARMRYNLLGCVFAAYLLAVVTTLIIQINASDGNLQIVSGMQNAGLVSESTDTIQPFVTENINGAGFINRFINYFNSNASVVVMIWAIFFLGKCVKLFGGIYYIQRIRTLKVWQPDRSWKEKALQLSATLGITQKVNLLESGIIKVPVAVGFLKATILVPVGLLNNLPPDQMESILLHELAHIKRRDYLVNLMQSFVETVFFFNPAVLWVSSLIHEEREACCDDIVMQQMPQRNSYLEALVSFQECNLGSSGYTMAFAGRRNFLLNRIQRLVTNENKKLNIPEKLVLVFGLIGLMAFGFVSRERTPYGDPGKKITISQSGQTRTFSGSDQANNAPFQKETISEPTGKKDTVPGKKIKLQQTGIRQYQFHSISENIYNDSSQSISANIHSDSSQKSYDVKAKSSEGTDFRVKKYNNQLTELVIDGISIPKNEFEKYKGIVEDIEKARMDAIKKSPYNQQAYRPLTTGRIYNQEYNKTYSNQYYKNYQPSIVNTDSQRVYKPKQYDNNRLFLNKNVRLKDNEYIKNIIIDLDIDMISGLDHDITNDHQDQNMEHRTKSLSFTLNKDELIVNGHRQNADVHEKFKSRYIKNDKDHFVYIHENGTTRTTIHVEQ